ncbi:glutathione S-transferase [Altererythrobacter aurantiacus]|uniref:glutathione transferase n=1 Tax=Parapontixanthobacter aurantiacus TaxID=1463599 RepID=A0A844ZAE9_9SPHN|nr:glutathione S-transferase [Parapontixanthobacter aurantiacus]MXO85541.1 glutathione S-transferase [Parapontixanthobacter aurantiacus]
MAIVVHHLNSSRSQRVLWLLEELEQPYEVIHYQRDSDTNLAPPELKNAHPLGKSPVIEDDGRVISESGAIIQYLCERHGGSDWLPRAGTDEYVSHLEWMQFGESSFFVPVMLKLFLARLGEAAAPVQPRIDEQLSAHIDFMESGIGDNLHFVGDGWTAADVLMSFPAEIALLQGYGEGHPKISRFVEKVHSRPAWQRARKKGGAYFVW